MPDPQETTQGTQPPTGVLSPQPSEPSGPPEFRVAGMFRRSMAFLIDWVILAAVCFGLSAALVYTVPGLGGWGRVIGMGLGMVYFGLINSSITGGQGLGKRILHLVVVDAAGRPLPVRRGLLRGLVFSVIVLSNGWALPIGKNLVVLLFIQSVIVFAGTAVMLYGFIFDRKTRRTLHDLAAGSYVVRQEEVAAPDVVAPAWRSLHRSIIIGIAVAGTAGLAALTIVGLQLMESAAPTALSLYERLLANPQFINVNVAETQTTSLQVAGTGTGETVNNLEISLWYAGECDTSADCYDVIDQIAREAFASGLDLSRFDNLSIHLTLRADLGWASFNLSTTRRWPIEDWRQQLGIPAQAERAEASST